MKAVTCYRFYVCRFKSLLKKSFPQVFPHPLKIINLIKQVKIRDEVKLKK